MIANNQSAQLFLEYYSENYSAFLKKKINKNPKLI